MSARDCTSLFPYIWLLFESRAFYFSHIQYGFAYSQISRKQSAAYHISGIYFYEFVCQSQVAYHVAFSLRLTLRLRVRQFGVLLLLKLRFCVCLLLLLAFPALPPTFVYFLLLCVQDRQMLADLGSLTLRMINIFLCYSHARHRNHRICLVHYLYIDCNFSCDQHQYTPHRDHYSCYILAFHYHRKYCK